MIRRDQSPHETPPDFDGTQCPKCGSRHTVEDSPPFKPHGTYWAAFVLCPECGFEWRAPFERP